MAEGENRAVEAAKRALSNPLLEDAFSDARAVIISVTGGEDMSLADVRAASSVIHEAAAEDASIIFGAAVDARLNGKINVTVVAKGVSDEAPQVKKTVDDSAETADPGSVILVWNPEVVSPDDYATVVEALGNLVRAEGAAGLRRIAHGTHNISLVDRVLQ
jgi:cell division GTPase FtsZ